MPLAVLPGYADYRRLNPIEPRYASMFCFALLTVSCALASFALACATPFAAFAVLAAAALPSRPALLVVASSWLVNQCIGFGALHYPIDASTIAWGLVIGVAALVATSVASGVFRALPQGRTPLMLAIALVCAYASYELTLFAVTPFMGGAGAFTLAIVTRIGMTTALWLSGLVAVCEIVRFATPLWQWRAAA